MFTHHLDIAPQTDPDELLRREWLLTNGTGAYSMGAAAGCNTRRYHGLLVAAGAMPGTRPPVGRVVALNQMWEQLVLSPRLAGDAQRPALYEAKGDAARHPLSGQDISQTLEFSTLLFRGDQGDRVYAPRGCGLLRSFDRGLSVKWSYVWGEIHFERELLLHWKQQAATLRYRILHAAPEERSDEGAGTSAVNMTLRLYPMLTLRDFHSLAHEHDASTPLLSESASEGAGITLTRDDLAVTLAVHAAAEERSDEGAGTNASRSTPHAPRFTSRPHWWRNVWYPAETERGQADTEDYFVPGSFDIDLTPPPSESGGGTSEGAGIHEVTLTIALGHDPVEPILDMRDRAAHLAKSSNFKFQTSNPQALNLAIAADDFIVQRQITPLLRSESASDEGAGISAPNPQSPQLTSTILAGYPWFADWGRDTFIALPGLLLAAGRFDEARATLNTFAGAIADGLVPNRFDDYGGGAHYNTVDASLWFIRAACLYVDASNDTAAWRDGLAQACMSIVQAYMAGTRNDIRMEDDGLISAGSADTQLTWMDAADGEGENRTVFTPRFGKCVEINALWHHALVELASRLPDSPTPPLSESASEGAGNKRDAARHPLNDLSLNKLVEKVAHSFNKTFWNEAGQCLFDRVWTDGQGEVHTDGTFRPNQVIALSLPHCPLPMTKQKKTLAAVREKLLTPAGLRTLPVEDPHYHPRYTGPRFERDEAYHQGTVWPWLIGPYAEAVLRVGRFSTKARRDARDAIAPLLHQFTRADPPVTLGQLPEIFDADPTPLLSESNGGASEGAGITRRPVGCIAQAWSVAEVLRVAALVGGTPHP